MLARQNDDERARDRVILPEDHLAYLFASGLKRLMELFEPFRHRFSPCAGALITRQAAR